MLKLIVWLSFVTVCFANVNVTIKFDTIWTITFDSYNYSNITDGFLENYHVTLHGNTTDTIIETYNVTIKHTIRNYTNINIQYSSTTCQTHAKSSWCSYDDDTKKIELHPYSSNSLNSDLYTIIVTAQITNDGYDSFVPIENKTVMVFNKYEDNVFSKTNLTKLMTFGDLSQFNKYAPLTVVANKLFGDALNNKTVYEVMQTNWCIFHIVGYANFVYLLSIMLLGIVVAIIGQIVGILALTYTTGMSIIIAIIGAGIVLYRNLEYVMCTLCVLFAIPYLTISLVKLCFEKHDNTAKTK